MARVHLGLVFVAISLCVTACGDSTSETPTPDPETCSTACGDHGSCDADTLVCTCDPGYGGDSCSECTEGFSQENGSCVLDFEGHPEGFEAPDQHSAAFKHGELRCTDCHGADLGGSGQAPSCDSCHHAGWRTDCTFCHGGTDNASGAPPRDLEGLTDAALATVGAHTAHLSGDRHPAFACEACHLTPTTLMDAGHVLDATPGVAEISFESGLSAGGSWDGEGCTNLVCHGDGDGNGGDVQSFTGAISTCDACHGAPPPTGRHHMGAHRRPCLTCHADVAGPDDTIISPELHVNGRKDVRLDGGGTYDPPTRTCNPRCHGNERW